MRKLITASVDQVCSTMFSHAYPTMFYVTPRIVCRLGLGNGARRQLHNTRVTRGLAVAPQCQNQIRGFLWMIPGHSCSDTFTKLLSVSTASFQGVGKWLRYLSTSTSLHSLKHEELIAGPFGKLTLRTTGAVSTEIRCLNPIKFPMMKMVVLTVESEEGLVELGEDRLQICQEGNNISLVINGPTEGTAISCAVDLPVKFDINADIKDIGDIYIENLENDEISVKTHQGDCLLNKIKTGIATLTSQNGDVRCDGVLQGNLFINTTCGTVQVHQVQGLTFNVKTESGDIKGKAIYADRTELVTSSGDVYIGSCHRDCSIRASGSSDVTIDSLDGDLLVQTQEGDVAISYVAQHGAIDISTDKGNVNLKLADSQKTNIDLEGSEVTLAQDFDLLASEKQMHKNRMRIKGLLKGGAVVDEKNADLLGSTQRRLVAKTGNGTISISIGDWFSSLRLQSESNGI